MLHVMDLARCDDEAVAAPLRSALWAFQRAAGVILGAAAPHSVEVSVRRAIPAGACERILARDGSCLACGSTTDLQVDHVIPLALGGQHSEANFQTLCGGCNSAKGARAVDYRLDP